VLPAKYSRRKNKARNFGIGLLACRIVGRKVRLRCDLRRDSPRHPLRRRRRLVPVAGLEQEHRFFQNSLLRNYHPTTGKTHKRKPTWSEANTDGRWRCYDYAELVKRDKLSLDVFWIKDKSLTDTDALPAPDILATEITDELETAFDLFSKIAKKLPKSAA
jgi:hypothetical protein